MTNLLTRIKDIIVADLNEALTKKEQQNPIAKLNQYLRECERETEKVGELVGRQVKLREEFGKEYNEAIKLAEKRKHQAEIASIAGETELYQFAAAEQQHYDERAQRLKASLTQVTEQLSELERKYEEMKRSVKDMQIRRMELMGRENVTRANLQMNQVLENDSYADSSYSKFKDIEGYLDRLEQKVKSSFLSSTIDERVEQLKKKLEK
ncbi:PspA/IM30 family protein [Neobacillus drentensis]|uniref:PspA/IM30 family protein n=1 Tax=Neobacillus drentensis TaxID=220684 RepID=UPI001F36A7FF|nr:PspA/IM30 family protein [Neobacillus drentensis]ULT56569.1 PspA/IM30 family protein [Neobacillus drentensis]